MAPLARLRATAVLLVGLLLSPALHARPPAVELVELPGRLSLPLPAGNNALFAVRIAGEPKAVWVAIDSGPDRPRLELSPLAGQWAFNLGDPRLAGVVAGGTQFQVFARFGDGALSSSLPVQFTPARPARTTLSARARKGADPTAVRGRWIEPSTVGAIRVSWGDSGPRLPVTLSAGPWQRSVPPANSGTVDVPVDDALRGAWSDAGTLRLVRADGSVSKLDAVPGRLDPKAEKTLKVVQRRSAIVPGSRGFLTLSLGDVSGSRVPVSLTRADGTPIVQQRLIREGDRVEFAMGRVRYVLVLDRLVNLLMGSDHAEFSIRRADAELAPPK